MLRTALYFEQLHIFLKFKHFYKLNNGSLFSIISCVEIATAKSTQNALIYGVEIYLPKREIP